ncbi:MAG TPA: tail fiber domain-containing protein [Bacteroidia bacterium]|nr:tail fiber domain-containing protein [Bacteroidia bacterium]HNU32487.1 tail fiber domain-containing protein [Bacteroidia bacterium]
MKKSILILTIILIITFNLNGQSVYPTNTYPPTPPIPPYVGWDNSITSAAQDLLIQHLANRNINLSTNNLIRMRIDAAGFVGIGQGFSTTPNSVLTLAGGNYQTGNMFETDGFNGALTQWRFLRGGTQRARFFNNNNDEHFHMEATRGDIIFDANGQGNNSAGTGPFQRMRISSGDGVDRFGFPSLNNTHVTIYKEPGSGFVNPEAMLNIGTTDFTPNPGVLGGRRDWMDVGTYYMFASDNMYVGLKNRQAGQSQDRFDAVINWGDNSGNTFNNSDNLRFIFTTSVNNGALPLAQSANGFEVGRFTSDGYFGIGNFSINTNGNGSNVQPLRRLEVYDHSIFTGLGYQPAPQFRLTFAPNANVAQGIWTDFQTTPRGDLYITPQNTNQLLNGFAFRNVGIQSAAPNYTLEVAGTGAFSNNGNPGNSTSPVNGFNMLSNNAGAGAQHPLIVKSNTDNRAITILRAGTSGVYEDGFTMFNDANGLMHFRSTGASSNNTYNISFDHMQSNTATTPTAWFGLNNNTKNVIFKNDFNTNPAPAVPEAKVYIEAQNGTGQDHRYALHARNINTSTATGLQIGIEGQSIGVRTPTGFSRNIGGLFRAAGIGNTSGSTNTAVYAVVDAAQTADENQAGLFLSTSTGSPRNYGIRAYANNANTTNVGIYAEANGNGAMAGHFQGSLTYTGSLIYGSDSILKTNVQPLKNASSILDLLNPLEYNYDKAKYPYMGFADGLRYGFLAQEVERLLPQFVSVIHYPGEYDDKGTMIHAPFDYKGLDYVAMMPLLFAAYHDLKQQVDACGCAGQRQGLNTLPNQNTTEVQLANSQTIYLDQNVPNPFETETNITYNIPQNINSAKIIFYNNNGNVLKEVEIRHKGAGTIKVYATELTAGIYNYSLIADGKVMDTKKMVKAQK